MKGGIVERQPVAPKPLGAKPLPIAKPIPLPPLQPVEKKPLVKNYVGPSTARPPVAPQPSYPSDEFSDNDELIKNMSPEEIQEALAEISSLLSKESIDFLMGKKTKGAESSASAAAVPAADESDDEVPDLEPQSTAAAPVSAASDVVPSAPSKGQIIDMPEEELFDLDGKRVLLQEEAYVLVANALAKHHASFLSMDPDRLIAISRTILSFFEGEHFVWRSTVEDGSFFSLPRALEVRPLCVKPGLCCFCFSCHIPAPFCLVCRCPGRR